MSRSGVPGKEKGVGRGDVVEIYGPSGSGKSEVLINVVVRCVLPAWLGGEERTAVFFDNGERAAQTVRLIASLPLSPLGRGQAVSACKDAMW